MQESLRMSSSQYPSTQKAKVAGGSVPGGQINVFGKTSGWYHGAKYDVAEMWEAAMNRDYELLKKCLKAGLNVNHSRWIKGDKVVGTGARSIVDVVVCRNNGKAMRLLLEYGVDLSGSTISLFASNTPQQRDTLFSGESRNMVKQTPWTTPLHLACRYGYIDMIRIILDEGHSDPNTRNCRSQTGLHVNAIGEGILEITTLLLDRGAAIDARDDSNTTPLAFAALFGKTELVEQLIDQGALIDAMDNLGETALYNASLQHHSDTVTALAIRGADMDVRNKNGFCAFFKAASRLKIDTMNLLTKYGADIDSRDTNGCTALSRAVFAKNIPLITYLLQLGLDIDIEDADGWTPLFAAMLHDEEEVIRILLQHGSDVGKPDNYNNTALHQAAIIGITLVVQHILAVQSHHTVNHSQMNHLGETSLILASKHNNSAIVKILLKHGANPHHIDPNGHRALDRAMYWASYACVRLLLIAGASIDSKSLFALQQGKYDNLDDAGSHDLIITRLQSQYPGMILPPAMSSSPLRDVFARTTSRDRLCARMREKQGKPISDPNLPGNKKVNKDSISLDPFEACIPVPQPFQIINNNNLFNVKANDTTALEIGAKIGTNLAVGITDTILQNIL